MICWAAKWLDAKRIEFASDHHDGHGAMVEQLWHLLDAADIVIGYNHVGFDNKHAAREFVLADLAPPAPWRDIDLLRAVRARFRFPINKLQHVATELGIGGKLPHTGFDLWKQCEAGDDKAWRLMRRYNRQDVALTETLYWRLRPWIKNHPHMGLFGGNRDGCPTCGSQNRTAVGSVTTGASAFPSYRCDDCGALSKSSLRSGPVTATRAL